jgi:hypothetical protein
MRIGVAREDAVVSARPGRSRPTAAGVARALAALALVALLGDAVESQSRRPIPLPATDVGEDMLPVLQWAQTRTAGRFDVRTDLRFADEIARSGITFVHRIVDDDGKLNKANHYDHGNGIAAADVDGDGRSDLYFVNQLGGNELWQNMGGGVFRDVTAEAGVGLDDRISVTASFADYDNDGDPDLYVTTVKMGNALFRNDGRGRFEDVTERAGLAYTGHSSGATFFDFDRDGDLDLFVANVGVYTTDERGTGGYYVGLSDAFSGHLHPERSEPSLLYRNEGNGTFHEVAKELGLDFASWSGDASFADLNGDLWPDLYVLNMQGDDHWFENREGRSFVDRTAALFPRTPWGTMGIKFFDWNNDGRLDLFLTDMHSDMSRDVTPGLEKLKSFMAWSDEQLGDGTNNIFGNAFFEQTADGGFVEVSDRIGAENYWPWGLSTGDLNADGWEDAFITASMNYPFRYGINTVLLNNRGEELLDSEFILGVEPRPEPRKTAWFDLDCGGADRAHPLCRTGPGGQFTILANKGSRSSVILDLDDDGDLDVVTNEFNSAPQVLVSDLQRGAGGPLVAVNRVKVKLVGKRSNRDGLGAVVTVRAGALTQTKQHDGKSGYLSQSSLPLYFGLGGAERPERVDVLWPSGQKQTLRRPQIQGDRLEIVEP